MRVRQLIARLQRADPEASVFLEALPESNEWTHVRAIGLTNRQPAKGSDLVTTAERRIPKGSVLIAARGPQPDTDGIYREMARTQR